VTFFPCRTMSHPHNLKASVDNINDYTLEQPHQEPEFGFRIEESGVQYRILCHLTDRVLAALRTKHAAHAFQRIAEYWRQEHMPDLDAEGSTRDFQELLKAASSNQREWPTIVIAWAMPSHVGGVHPRNIPLNTWMSDSWIEDQYIALNGIVSTPEASIST
jgi:hypothetical protein